MWCDSEKLGSVSGCKSYGSVASPPWVQLVLTTYSLPECVWSSDKIQLHVDI